MTRHASRRIALCAPRPDHRGARAARCVAPFKPLAGFALDVPNQVSNLGAFPEGAPSSVSASARSLARRTDAESRPIAAPFATARFPTAGSSQTTAGPDGETSSAQVAAERTPERASATARANADWRAPTDERRAAGETGRAGRRTGQAARREAPPAHGTIKHLASLSRVSSHRLAGGGGGDIPARIGREALSRLRSARERPARGVRIPRPAGRTWRRVAPRRA